jgi:hypothetical protein
MLYAIRVACVSLLVFAAAPASATVFAALGATTVQEETDYGIVRVDTASSPPRISVGEMKSVWDGVWQPGGGSIVINRAQESIVPFNGASEKVRFRARWVAGNEAVAIKAKHVFRLTVYRIDQSGARTEAASAKKEVTVDAKRFGGTKFKDGNFETGTITVSGPATYEVVLKAENANSNDAFTAKVVVHFQKQ